MYKVIDYPEGSEVGTIIGDNMRDLTAAHFLADKTGKGHRAEVYSNVNGEEILVYRTRGAR